MLTAMALWQKALPAAPVDDYKTLPPTPGVKPPPPSIAQLALPSPESSSQSTDSSASHDPFCAPASPRRRNKLRKPPPSSYPFSFVAENPSPTANFPYSFASTPASPVASFVSTRALSVHTVHRKLTKRRPSQTPDAPPLPPTLQRSSTFTFTLRRKKTSSHSELGHDLLPALPPPSPLAIVSFHSLRTSRLTTFQPTFRPFHARRRDSWHAHPSQHPATPPHPPAPFDDVAWTGVAPRGFDTIIHTSGWRSTWSLALPDERRRPKFVLDDTDSPRSNSRPPLLRRDAVTASPKRRWTLAMALNDEGISDELLVAKLEALRSRSRSRVGSFAASDTGETSDWDQVWAAYDDEIESDTDVPPPPPPKDTLPSMPALPSPSTATWQSARRALLTCRELVRTERHYLASLRLLLTPGATRTPPPPLMLAYAAELVRESAGLLSRMEEDPSAWGVAAAFLGAEEGVGAALVGWCGVVGGWFVDGASSGTSGRKRLSKLRGVSEGGERGMWNRRGSGAEGSVGMLSAGSMGMLSAASVGMLSAKAPTIGRTSSTGHVSRLAALAEGEYAQSSVGHSYAQSSSGHGYAQSSIGHGYAQSSSGHGYAQSSIGHSYAQSSSGHAYASTVGHSYAKSSSGHTVANQPPSPSAASFRARKETKERGATKERNTTTTKETKERKKEAKKELAEAERKKPAVRDLAIVPTQRVMRPPRTHTSQQPLARARGARGGRRGGHCAEV
ncbi:hypothetical protein C8R43DRAFT_1175582 [Mycena crocata]|nr:hypothetical protein C8R43DRAFT_1175582 [Mycena crocata]